MEDIILIGGGGHCRSVIDVIESENKFLIRGIVDQKEFINKKILDYPFIGTSDDLSAIFRDFKNAFITVGQIRDPMPRINIFNQLKEIGYFLPTITSPRAYISKSSNIAEGSIIMHDALINSTVSIGRNCIINTKALIEHDSIVEDFCHISTGAIINGGVTVGEKTFFGSGAVSREGASIPASSFIKLNSNFI